VENKKTNEESLIKNTHSDQAIGVFDSGLGGISILSKIRQLLPNEKLIYFGDSAYAPYGDQSSTFIRQRTIEITDFFIKNKVKAIVIACNTATAESIEFLREYTDIPIIGIEPPVKPACKQPKSKIIGIIATQYTINSNRLRSLIANYGDNTRIILQPCPELAKQVEACELSSRTTRNLLKRYIQPLVDQNIDTLILGCTHYPFLLPSIREIIGERIPVFETSKPVANELKRVLKVNDLINTSTVNNNANTLFYNSKKSKKMQSSMQALWKLSNTA